MGECSVCYGECGRLRRLVCGHEFCSKCICEWYTKGAGSGCPMCRRPIYFRGLRMLRKQWDEISWREKADEYFAEAFDYIFEINEGLPKYFLIDDLRDLESTYQVLIEDHADLEEIEYIMYDPDEYYFSIRRFGRERDKPYIDFIPETPPDERPIHNIMPWWLTT